MFYDLSALVGCFSSVSIRRIMSFWLHGCCGQWKRWDPINRFNHTSWAAIVITTDRPKSVRNRCVIEVFGGGFFVLWVTLLFGFFCGCRGFCPKTESDLFLFLLTDEQEKVHICFVHSHHHFSHFEQQMSRSMNVRLFGKSLIDILRV